MQAQGSIAAEEKAGKANARAVELEKQVWNTKVHEHLERVNYVFCDFSFYFSSIPDREAQKGY